MALKEKRTINPEEKKMFLAIKPEDINLEMLQGLFADHYEKNKVVTSKFNTYDEFKLEKNEFHNKEAITTNCGLFIVNKYFFEPDDLFDKAIGGYINEPMDKGVVGKIYTKMADALLEDRITTEEYIGFLNRLCWLSFSFHTEVTTSLTIHSMKELPEVKKARDEMIKKNKDALQPGNVDIATVTKMEKELVDVAKKSMKDDTAIDLYNSGARGAFNVAYKNAQVMKGPVLNSANGEWEVMTNPLATGIEKDNIPVLANNVIDSAYGKAISTGECGYLTKKLAAAFQGNSLDKKGSDCGTKMYSEIVIDGDTFDYYKYGYMVEGSKLVRLDYSNYDKYKGKKVKMRTNDYCIGKKICNKCAGDLYYLLGIDNIGLTSTRVSNSMLRARMKVFHDSTVKTYEIKPEDFL